MNIDIICVGKVKEAFFRDAIDEYLKRLSKFAKVSVYEAKDEKTPDNSSEKEEQIILQKESERLLKYINKDAYIVPLCIEGKQKTSTELADTISNIELSGISHIQFIIGGSLGLCDNIKNLAKEKLSFSKMTFPHQLMRVILLEQIYRAYKIKSGEPYHK